MQRYGDNIYHRVNGVYVQDDSFHSYADGSTSLANLKRDTGCTDRVMVSSSNFTYWGGDARPFPDSLAGFVVPGVGHKCRFKDSDVRRLIKWLHSFDARGLVGEPAQWTQGKRS